MSEFIHPTPVSKEELKKFIAAKHVGASGLVVDRDLDDVLTHVAMSDPFRTRTKTDEIVAAGYEIFPETGKIEVTVPLSASRGCAGFAKNAALQMAKKEMARARLAKKLEARKGK
jgi:hypothetical protein